jgi:hypothetical protein
MSGSGSSGGGSWRPEPKPGQQVGSAEGGGGREAPDPCAIVEVTNLNSVDATVLRGVRLGDRLNVVYRTGPPIRLLAETPTGEVLGSITSPSMAQIIQCIGQRGRRYIAEVRVIRGGICEVEVRPL